MPISPYLILHAHAQCYVSSVGVRWLKKSKLAWSCSGPLHHQGAQSCNQDLDQVFLSLVPGAAGWPSIHCNFAWLHRCCLPGSWPDSESCVFQALVAQNAHESANRVPPWHSQGLLWFGVRTGRTGAWESGGSTGDAEQSTEDPSASAWFTRRCEENPTNDHQIDRWRPSEQQASKLSHWPQFSQAEPNRMPWVNMS